MTVERSPGLNFADRCEAIASVIPDRGALVWRDRRLTCAQLAARSRRLALYPYRRGLGARTERDRLAGHESGEDHVARYMLRKAYVLRDEIVRPPSGKADYRFAKAQAVESTPASPPHSRLDSLRELNFPRE